MKSFVLLICFLLTSNAFSFKIVKNKEDITENYVSGLKNNEDQQGYDGGKKSISGEGVSLSPIRSAIDRPNYRLTDKPTEKPTSRPTEKPTEKPTEMPTTPTSTQSPPNDDDHCEAGLTKCSLDCSSLILCPSQDTPIKVNCADQSGGTLPYCNNKASPIQCASSSNCEELPINHCEHLEPGYYYPDLLNCTQYYYCNDDHATEGPEFCTDSRFEPISQTCESSLNCTIFSASTLCKGHYKQLIQHPLAKFLYVYCGNVPELFSCDLRGYPDNFDISFDPKTSSCVFKCLNSGRFPSLQGKEFYWDCVKNGTNFIGEERECPANAVFVTDQNGLNGRCEHVY